MPKAVPEQESPDVGAENPRGSTTVGHQRLRLAIFDIDGTLRRIRDPWRLLHHCLGVAAQAEELPDLWGRGEISYEQWARLDASLWKGFSREAILQTLQMNPLRRGARELVRWFSCRSIPCVAISTGLSVFNDITARELGLSKVICNELDFSDNICTGRVTVRVREDNKAEVMENLLGRYGTPAAEVVAFGDGSADIPLLQRAALGVAICPANAAVRQSGAQVVSHEPIHSAIRIVEQHFDPGENLACSLARRRGF